MNDRQYLDISKGLPSGETIYYECLLCGDILPSISEHGAACQCRNVIIDVYAGRVALKDANNLRAFSTE